jgi:hypothetical protein
VEIIIKTLLNGWLAIVIDFLIKDNIIWNII